MRVAIVVLFGALMLLGCTNKEIYETVQDNRRAECQKLPPSQERDCMERYQDSFEDYKEQREELLKP